MGYGQLVITRYLFSGFAIGLGGLSFVRKMVQVGTVAQFGFVYLLFSLVLEFSSTKLRGVLAIAVLRGFLKIFLFHVFVWNYYLVMW